MGWKAGAALSKFSDAWEKYYYYAKFYDSSIPTLTSINLILPYLTLPNPTKPSSFTMFGAVMGSLALQGTFSASCQIQKLPKIPKEFDWQC